MVVNKKESEIQKEILFWLKENGYKVWKNYLGPLFIKGGYHAKNPNAGQPDIYGIMKKFRGRLFAIELKSSKGKLSDIQKTELLELENAGVFVMAERSLERVIRLLNEEEGKAV